MVGASLTASDLGGVPQMMGRYAPVARLGKGGMADVFLTLAHGPQGVNKLAVLKRLRERENHALTAMFLDEARLAARLNHANIVHTYEAGEAGGEYFIAMEYLEGQPLNAVLKKLEARGEGLSEAFVCFIAIEALKGLHYAHEFCDFDGTPLAVVHRDVSPHNLFLTYGGEVKLVDFGIAKAAVNVTHTEEGVLKGKVRYMAPEQATQKDVDRRVDIFAFGVVVWEMLARRPLFTGAPLSILTRIVSEEVPHVRSVRPEIAPALDAIVHKALRRNRSERYQTAEEMRLDIEAYLRGRSDLASERDLARMMNEKFSDVRDDVRAQVKAYTSSVASQSLIPSAPGFTGTGSLPVLAGWTNPPTSSSMPGPFAPISEDSSERTARSHISAAPMPRRRPVALIVGGAALAAAAVTIGVLAFRSSHAKEDSGAAAAPPPPVVAPAEAHVHLKTTPTGALVEWNGMTFGPTPTDLAITPGSQALRISRDGYEPTMIIVDAKPGDDVSRSVTLQVNRPNDGTPAAGAAPRRAAPPAAVWPVGKRYHPPAAAPPAPSPPPATATAPASATAQPKPKIRVLDENDTSGGN